MALMSYREMNQVVWVGTRPGHNGTQQYFSIVRNVIGSWTIGAADATRTQFVTHLWLSMPDNLAQEADVVLYDAVPAVVVSLIHGYTSVGYSGKTVSVNFWPPFELVPTFTLRLRITAATAVVAGSLGWIE